MKQRWIIRLQLVSAIVVGLSGVAGAASDPTFSSNGYSVVESEIGAAGNYNSGSAGYSMLPGIDDSGTTLGESTAGGTSSSTNYQTGSGFNTTAQPGLTMIVNTSLVDFGNVTTATKLTQTATFTVKNYTSYGYVTQIIGTAPTMGGHTLSPLTTDTAYSAAAEQFGVNIVRNTVSAVGADPVQNPSGMGYGIAGDGIHSYYTISDQWRYNSGEVVASAPKSSGETLYTLTFMMNATTLTPGGQYRGAITLVTVGTY